MRGFIGGLNHIKVLVYLEKNPVVCVSDLSFAGRPPIPRQSKGEN